MRGVIAYYHLEEWWRSAFSDSERERIQSTYQPLGMSVGLTAGEVTYISQGVVGFLGGLASWFAKAPDRPIAYKIFQYALTQVADADPIETHFLYQQMIEIFYKSREQPEFLEKAIAACHDQINLAPKAAPAFLAKRWCTSLPGHKGYEQLAIILEKRGELNSVIELCEQASAQGWAGNWSHRIERCQKKLVKKV